MGPASGGLQVLTRRRKARKGVGYSGTPWSGHAVNWNCLTSRFSLDPFWGARESERERQRERERERERERQDGSKISTHSRTLCAVIAFID